MVEYFPKNVTNIYVKSEEIIWLAYFFIVPLYGGARP
ncbi:hypothetical protein SAMN05421677_107212 [Halobacillus aidingensis]|uniref:Uncharacterized protein n=1 Tax=Halobacillus aidingensis TaxID=240303 RepID=A0A1H0M4B3_HALAD|nr:hypothetical protein SAMN05421677_107212 [Halobacillus aidingensis]